ncbi:MAG: SMP-30/gluconolactonase/LRE family protein [Candidatus Promineifilaceae bacterium]
MLTSIKNLELIPIGPHPEDVLIAPDGSVYMGLEDGRIMCMATADNAMREVANTGGRPLGLEFMLDGRLAVCDTRKGLLAVDANTGEVEVLVAKGQSSLNVCNNCAVAADGRIFFSDSTQRFTENEAVKDIVDCIATGRLLCWHADGRVEQLIDGLLFANGVLVAPDQSFVLVAQTGRGCINRLWLTGEKAGQQDKFVVELPGLPDNLALGSDGLIWVALVTPFSDDLRRLHAAPRIVRYLVARLPQRLQPKQENYCRVASLDLTGNLINIYDGDSEHYHFVTGVREYNGTVYLGSFENDAIARFQVKETKQ